MVTIYDSPAFITPAFNPVVFSLTSNNYLQPGFKFVADVYSGSGQLMASLKYQPHAVGSDPVTFDISRILHELVSTDYCKLNEVASPSIITPAGGAIADYSVQFGEQYNNIIYANQSSFSGYVFNGAINPIKFAFFNYSIITNKSFLTQFKRHTVRKSDSVMCSILQSDLSSITGFYLDIYNHSGNNIYNRFIPNPYTSLTATNNRCLHLHVGYNYLYSIIGWSGEINNSASYYTITPAGGFAMRFDLYSLCERFPGNRLHFLNQYGSFDSFNFMLASKTHIATERKSYQRQPSNYRSGYDRSNKRFEVLTRNYNTIYSEKRTFISDYLTDAEAELLKELLTSPLVYIEDIATTPEGSVKILIPVQLVTLEYDIKQARTDKLFNMELDVEITYSAKMQSI